jgi:hypothetical protein
MSEHASKILRTVRDRTYTTAEAVITDSEATVWRANGTPAKLSTAWVTRCENDTTARQAIEKVAEQLWAMDLITDEGYRFFLYRIGKRDQIEAYDFEDVDELAQLMTAARHDIDGLHALWTTMEEGVGVSLARGLWTQAQGRVLSARDGS